MTGKLLELVSWVQRNMQARVGGISAEYVRDTISDVLDGLAAVEWEAVMESSVCESEFDELLEDEDVPEVL